MDDLRCVAPVGDKCGEAATWSADEQALYWCDVNRFLVHRLGSDQAVRSWFFDEPVTALALTEEAGTLLVALGSKLVLWCPEGNLRRDHGFRLDGWPRSRLNDGRAAPNGDFWIGSMANNVGPRGEPGPVEPGLGVLYRLQPGAKATAHKFEIGISNTVCWSPDQRTFYFGDTHADVVWAYDYDSKTGGIANERVLFSDFGRGAPDGSAVDAEGYLWNCRFGGGCIVRVGPRGLIDRVVELPVRNVTTCAFGGADLRTLFITTAAMMTDESDRLAGSLFALRTEVPGTLGFKVRL